VKKLMLQLAASAIRSKGFINLVEFREARPSIRL